MCRSVVYEFDIRERERELNGEQHTTVSAYVTEVLGKEVGEFQSQSKFISLPK